MGLIKQLRTGEPYVVSFFMVKLVKHLNPTFLVDHLFTVPSTIICLGNAKWFLCSPLKKKELSRECGYPNRSEPLLPHHWMVS